MTKEEFTVLFNYFTVKTGAGDRALARVLQISMPTVDRWRKGITAPHVVGRKPVIDFLFKEAAEYILYG